MCPVCDGRREQAVAEVGCGVQTCGAHAVHMRCMLERDRGEVESCSTTVHTDGAAMRAKLASLGA